MQLRYPRSVQILSQTVKIHWDASEYGGSCDYREGQITIGTAFRDPLQIFNTIVHECGEYIHMAQNTRYEAMGGCRDYVFVMTHKEYENHVSILAQVLSQFIK